MRAPPTSIADRRGLGDGGLGFGISQDVPRLALDDGARSTNEIPVYAPSEDKVETPGGMQTLLTLRTFLPDVAGRHPA